MELYLEGILTVVGVGLGAMLPRALREGHASCIALAHAKSHGDPPKRATTSNAKNKSLEVCHRTVACSLLLISGVVGTLYCFLSPPPFSLRVERSSGPSTQETRIYFGAGCFWHIQYEFVRAEQDATGPFCGGRDDAGVSSLAGYAGGKWQSPLASVCYHGMPHADYGRLGHAEAISIRLDESNASAQLSALAATYFGLFRSVMCSRAEPHCADGRRRQRPDPANNGPEYRNVIGFPGGMDDRTKMALISSENVNGMPVLRGGGDDDESEYVVYIYDSSEYPFFAAEPYHQLHSDPVLAPAMPESYKRVLRNVLEQLGRFKGSEGCTSFPAEFAWIWPLMAGVPLGMVLAMSQSFAKELLAQLLVRTGCRAGATVTADA